MPISHCLRCGLIFAPEAPAGDAAVCERCLGRLRRGGPFRSGFDPRDAPLFRAVAGQGRRADGLRCALGLPAGPGSTFA